MDNSAFLEGQELVTHVAHGAPRTRELRALRRKRGRRGSKRKQSKSVDGNSRKRQRLRSSSGSRKRPRIDESRHQRGRSSQREAAKRRGSSFPRHGERGRRVSSTKTSLNPSSRSRSKPGRKVRQERSREITARKTSRKKSSNDDDMCWNYMRGNCRRGASCKWLHEKRHETPSNADLLRRKPTHSNGSAPLRSSKSRPNSTAKKSRIPCKDTHELKKYRGYYRCRLCSKTLSEVFLCRNCTWAACIKCLDARTKSKKGSTRVVGSKTNPKMKKRPRVKIEVRTDSEKNIIGAEKISTSKIRKTQPTKSKNTRRSNIQETQNSTVPVNKKKLVTKKKISAKVQKNAVDEQTSTSEPLINDNFEIVSESEEGITLMSLTSSDMCARLRSTGKEPLMKVAQIFEDEELDGEDIAGLTRRELCQLLPKLGMRKKLERFVIDLESKPANLSVEQKTKHSTDSPQKLWIDSLVEGGSSPLAKENGSVTKNIEGNSARVAAGRSSRRRRRRRRRRKEP